MGGWRGAAKSRRVQTAGHTHMAAAAASAKDQGSLNSKAPGHRGFGCNPRPRRRRFSLPFWPISRPRTARHRSPDSKSERPLWHHLPHAAQTNDKFPRHEMALSLCCVSRLNSRTLWILLFGPWHLRRAALTPRGFARLGLSEQPASEAGKPSFPSQPMMARRFGITLALHALARLSLSTVEPLPMSLPCYRPERQ